LGWTPVLEPYLPSVHGVDALLSIWHVAVSAGEHTRVFGQYARSPSLFITSCAQCELLVAHEPEAVWQQGKGLMGLSLVDDTEERCRGRLHHYALPAYRHPAITLALGERVLAYLFEIRKYAYLYGLTPAPNRAAVRFALRLGFTIQSVWPQALMYDDAPCDAVHTAMTREQWSIHDVGRGQENHDDDAVHSS